jgi:hypothetical protein
MNTMSNYTLRNWFLFEGGHMAMRGCKQSTTSPLQSSSGETVTALDEILFYLILFGLGVLIGEMVLQSFFRITGVL